MSNIEIIKELYQAFAVGNMDRIMEIIDPNVLWIESEGIPYGGTYCGRDAVFNEMFAKIGAEWENFTATVDEFIDAGDRVITLGYDSGTYKATGKHMRAPAASIWTLRDGKVVHFVQYIDTLKVASAATPGD